MEQGLRLAEANLADMWANYNAAGYSRLIFTNTACVRADVLPDLVTALGDDPVVHAVLLSATDDVAETRLAQREIGEGLASHCLLVATRADASPCRERVAGSTRPTLPRSTSRAFTRRARESGLRPVTMLRDYSFGTA